MKKLKYIIYGLLLAVTFTSCDENEGFLGNSNSTNIDGLKKSYKTVEIEDCQYIIYDAGQGYTGFGYFAHKGNCKNEIHTCK